MLHAIAAVFLVKVNDGFSVAARAVVMPLGFQFGAQFCVVVDFAVENDPDILIFVGRAAGVRLDVDDAQPAHGQANILFDEETFIIGPAMDDAAVHARQHVARARASRDSERRFRRFRT